MSILIYFATIFWSLFPNLIHVFQGGDNFINKVNATNLVSNGDLSIDSNNDNIPDGFDYVNVTDISLNNGIAKFTATAQNGRIRLPYSEYIQFNVTEKYYVFANLKADNSKISLSSYNFHSGSGNFEFLSVVNTFANTANIGMILDSRASGWTPIEVDYIGAFNVSQMIDKGVKNDSGISFSDLTDLEIQEQLDLWITEYGNLDFKVIYDNTADQWFDTGFVEKTAERDFIDYLGYFVWLLTPPIILFATLDLLRRVI